MKAEHVVKEGEGQVPGHPSEFIDIHLLCQHGDSFRPGEYLKVEQLVFRVPEPAGGGTAGQKEFPSVKLDAHFPVGVEQAVPVHAEEAGMVGGQEFLPFHHPAVRDMAVLPAEEAEAVQMADVVSDDDVRPFPDGHLSHGFHAVRKNGVVPVHEHHILSRGHVHAGVARGVHPRVLPGDDPDVLMPRRIGVQNVRRAVRGTVIDQDDFQR